MNYTKFKFVLILLCFGLLAVITGCTEKNAQDKADTPNKTTAPVDSVVIELAGADSVSVFDLLQAKHEIEYRGSLMGNLVTSIDSVAAGSGYYWMYSVNDSMAKMACDQYFTSDSDVVRWHYRKAGE